MKSVVLLAITGLYTVCYGSDGSDGATKSTASLYRNPSSSFVFNLQTNPVRSLSNAEGMILLYFAKPYLQSSSNEFSAYADFRVGRGKLSGNIAFRGFDLFNEMFLSFSYADQLFENLKYGVELQFVSMRISELGNKQIITANLAFEYEAIDGLTISTIIRNPFEWKLDKETGQIYPLEIVSGCEYVISPKVKIILDLRKELRNKIQLAKSIYYSAFDKAGFHVGYGVNPSSMIIGSCYNHSSFSVELAFIHKRFLGVSPTLQIAYCLGK